MRENYGKISELAREIVTACTKRGYKTAAAESCTGGMISAAITSIEGSSAVTELGVCSYSNKIKTEVLGVSRQTLQAYTEYSIECAKEMAAGALKLSGADFAVSTTGVAGPTGGTELNPVGTVYICVYGKNGRVSAERFNFDGLDREGVRAAAAEKALELLLKTIIAV